MAETITNYFSLIAVLTGLIVCFFFYVSNVRREYQLLNGFLLGDFLSTYYWVVYIFVVGDHPDSSALMAYFGWNAGYVLLLLLARYVTDHGARRYFHPLMLLPVPVNFAQFLLYIQYGAYFNNAWHGIFATLIMILCIQGLLYNRKQNKRGENNAVLAVLLLYCLFQYAAFTVSCFTLPEEWPDLYSIFNFAQYTCNIMLPFAVAKMYGDRIRETKESDAADFRNMLRLIFVALVVGVSFAGYLLAGWMQSLLAPGEGEILSEHAAQIIIILLFVVSVALSILVITILITLSRGQRAMESASVEENIPEKPGRVPETGHADSGTTGSGAATVSDRENRTIMRRWNLVLPLLITFILLLLVVFYTSRQFYRISVEKSHEDAMEKVSGTAERLQNYMDTAKSVLWVTADTVDYMIANGESDAHIRRYLEQETENQRTQFDENYTGVYGYIRGVYMDGSLWEPPADYVPTERDWYLAAMEAGGDVTIAQPYVDMQTGSVVISVCKQLKDDRDSALSLDLIIGYVQSVVEETNVGGLGYCFILDSDGTVIAHRDPSMNGLDIRSLAYDPELLQNAEQTEQGFFESSVDGRMSTVFTDSVMNQWRIMIVIGNDALFADVYRILTVNGLIFLIVFVLIAVFYSIAYHREERSSREAHTLRIREQQQTYEAEILRLEKQSADAANAAKSSFLADMSHEIRTPINAVLGMNEMILRESTSDRITTYARNLESAGKNLLSIINDILDFSKIEAGKMEIVEAPYQLSSVLNDVSNMIAFRARAKDLTFLVDVDETIPDNLYGDEVRVRQVVTNILTNAVKYTMEGSVTLSVHANRLAENRIDLIIDVKDTGIGIREEDIGNLFTKFGRVDLNKTNTIEGTGLGLAITENLLLLMQGDVRVQSVYGEGSTFTLRIPQTVLKEDAIGDFHQRFEEGLKQMKTYRESFRAPEARVLVVDDTELNLVVIEGLLKTTEVHLDTATGGEEALGLCKDTPYDLILMDQRMPYMNGTETLRHIRAQEGGCNRETPVLCLTADAVQGARERYLEEGFSGYLSKPVEGSALEAALMEFLPAEKVIRKTGEERPQEPSAENPLRAVYDSTDMLHFDTAMSYSASEEMLEKTLKVFYESLPEKTEEIRRFLEEADYENYTIRVHALKSVGRIIGATEISALAEKLEASGDAVRADGTEQAGEAAGFIREQTPKLLSALNELEACLRPCFEADEAEDESLPAISREELEELYEAIPEFAEAYDQNGILKLLNQADGYRLPEDDRKRLARIRKAAQNSDWGGLAEALQKAD